MINENIMYQIKDTLVHKELVMQCGYKMCEYLSENNKDDLALELINRIIVHDNSKFTKSELYGLSTIFNRSALIDPTVLLSPQQQDVIQTHWYNNRHHPEYFDDVSEMLEIDIIEMVCDWYARSIQCNTDLISFIEIRQENRFHFPEKIYKKIIEYCNVLLNR